MPARVLHLLAALSLIYAAYSLSCWLWVRRHHRLFLGIVIVANLGYCLLTGGLLIGLRSSLSGLGAGYFLAEILVVLGLVWFEMSTLRKLRTGADTSARS